MKDIYPEYAENVDFYAVAVSKSFDNLDRLEAHRERNGYPWPVANAADEEPDPGRVERRLPVHQGGL